MVSKRRCPNCGSKHWHKDALTGQISCSVCHRLQDYRNESNEGIEFGPHAMRKRTLKSTRVKNENKSFANHILYHGDRARYHYFECLQVLLRMQIKKLTELWSLPPGFENVCRDTWSLHLSLQSSPPPPEPYLHSEDQYGHHQADLPGKGSEAGKKQKEEWQSGDEAKSPSVSDADSLSSPHNEGEDAADLNMAELLREASESESSESGGDEQGRPSQGKRTSRKPQKAWRRDDSPAATVCVLVHSCWLMRIPVMYNDVVNLIESYSLPYLDPIRLLPSSLTRHLTKHAKHALSPHHAPTPAFLHTITSRLSELCFERYGIFTPEFNTAPVLWRTVRHLNGTPTLYAVTKVLAQYLELPLTLNPAMAPPVLRQSNRDPASHKSDNVTPEVALAAMVVIALKIIYGLDGKGVYPMEAWNPAWAMPAVEMYMDQLQAMNASDIDASRDSNIVSPDCMAGARDEDKQNLDAYLNFCERALLGRARGDNKAAGNINDDLVAEYFPLQNSMEADERPTTITHDTDGNSNDDTRPVLAAVGAEPSDSESLVQHGGSYAIYSAHDIFGRLPDDYVAVLGRAARWTGVSEDDLSAVAERFEHRLVRLWKRSKRRSKMKVEEEGEEEEEEEEEEATDSDGNN